MKYILILFLLVSGLNAQTTNTMTGVTFTGVNITYTPRALGAALTEWWTQDSPMTMGTATTVIQWNNLISSRHLLSDLSANQPTLTAGGPNGYNYLAFDGSSDRMTNGLVAAQFSGNDIPMSGWMVIRPFDGNNTGFISLGNNGNTGGTNSFFSFRPLQAGTSFRLAKTDDVNVALTATQSGSTSNAFCFYGWSFSGTRVTMSVNGVLQDSSFNNGVCTYDTFGVGIFPRNGAVAQPYHADIVELGFTTNSIGTNALTQLYFNYARPKYSLP